MLPPRGPDAASQDRDRVLHVLRSQGVTVLWDVDSGMARLRRGNVIRAYRFEARVPNFMLRRIAAEYDFDFLSFYFDQIENEPD